jgi:hypothetical protein
MLEFYSLTEFEEWKDLHKEEKYATEYLKGLASSDNAAWKQYLSESNLDKNLLYIDSFNVDDMKVIKLLFSKDKGFSNMRKQWLDIE